jgi:hypothetical protein
MNNYTDKLKLQTRWDTILNEKDSYRLLCNHATCSLSCANIRKGKLSVTSTHGAERHSYILSKKDMAFLTAMFLDSLSEEELKTYCKAFNKISTEFLLNVEKI